MPIISDFPTGRNDYALNSALNTEISNRLAADNNLQGQIDAVVSKSDVVDVLANYAALQSYNTSTLGNNDVVKVLLDSTHDNSRTYYRWIIENSVGEWSYIGTESVGYTKAETDTLLNTKQPIIDAEHKLSYNYISDKPSIPSAVTESTVSGWGFTKNTGTYSKPTDGIPASDLASSVRSILNSSYPVGGTLMYSFTEEQLTM